MVPNILKYSLWHARQGDTISNFSSVVKNQTQGIKFAFKLIANSVLSDTGLLSGQLELQGVAVLKWDFMKSLWVDPVLCLKPKYIGFFNHLKLWYGFSHLRKNMFYDFFKNFSYCKLKKKLDILVVTHDKRVADFFVYSLHNQQS